MGKVNLNVFKVIAAGMRVGVKNFPSLFLAAVLYILTCWIPYINVGTTIAIQTLPGCLANGKIISPLFIFDSKYRDDFSAFFLLCAFMTLAMLIGLGCMIIPAFVIGISMCFATIILVEDKVSPIDAMKLSNNATKGYKWKIFFIYLIFSLLFLLGYVIVFLMIIIIECGDVCLLFLSMLYSALFIPFSLGITSVLYNELYIKRKVPVVAPASAE
jgi:uncharacterized membrane protein